MNSVMTLQVELDRLMLITTMEQVALDQVTH